MKVLRKINIKKNLINSLGLITNDLELQKKLMLNQMKKKIIYILI